MTRILDAMHADDNAARDTDLLAAVAASEPQTVWVAYFDHYHETSQLVGVADTAEDARLMADAAIADLGYLRQAETWNEWNGLWVLRLGSSTDITLAPMPFLRTR